MNLGGNLPDHVAGPGCCNAAVEVNPLVSFERVFDPLSELSDFRWMHEELFSVQPLDEVALFHSSWCWDLQQVSFWGVPCQPSRVELEVDSSKLPVQVSGGNAVRLVGFPWGVKGAEPMHNAINSEASPKTSLVFLDSLRETRSRLVAAIDSVLTNSGQTQVLPSVVVPVAINVIDFQLAGIFVCHPHPNDAMSCVVLLIDVDP